jgi:tRNA 2-thiouridine synthesizing protein A
MNLVAVADYILDVSGHKCPIPVLRLRRALEKSVIGTTVALKATDPMTLIDVPNYCREAGHLIEDVDESDGQILYIIRKC